MEASDPVKVHELLSQVREGDSDALDRLIPLVFDELEELARVQRRRWHGNISVHTGSLLNEAYMRLAGQEAPQWRDRAHFMAVAATAMRHILTSHARKRHAAKRGGKQVQVTLTDIVLGGASPGGIDLLGKPGGNSNQLLEPSGGGATDLLSAMMGPGPAPGGSVTQPPPTQQQDPMNLLNDAGAFGGDGMFPSDTAG